MPAPVDALVRAALSVDDPGDACAEALDVLRAALGAERALLARGGPGSRPVAVHQAPAGAEAAVAELLGPALDADEPLALDAPGAAAVLALGLRPHDDARWCLAVVRARSHPWSPGDRETLGRLGPHVVLLLDYALLHQRLTEERARQAAAAAARERFMNVLAHELRNPLAPILMWTSTLKRLRKEDADVLRAAQGIEHAVTLARRLLDDLLDASRLERGMVTLRSERLDLREVLWRTVDLHRAQAEDGRLALVVDVAADAVPVDGDPARLAQVIGNLVGNAIKFTPPDGRIVVGLTRREDRACLSVSDTGPGLPLDVGAAGFTPFVQGPNARGGMGIGLAVTRWLVELHGGRVDVVPQGLHGGATFRVTLPVAPC